MESTLSPFAIKALPGASADVIPGPGLYAGVPDEVYHKWNICSKHKLDTINDKSPMHLKYAVDHPDDSSTPDKELGKALHTLLLEPDVFPVRHPVSKMCQKPTAGGGACKNPGRYLVEGLWLCGQHCKGQTEPSGMLTPDQYETVNRMADSIRKHPAAAPFLMETEQAINELTGIWNESVTIDNTPYTLRKKFRIDLFRPTWSSLGDIKKTNDASPDAFESSIGKYGYHRQSAYYLDGLCAHGIRLEHFVFVCVEDAPPYACACYELKPDDIDLARDENARLSKIYAQCERMNHWWGYDSAFTTIEVPQWTRRKALRIRD